MQTAEIVSTQGFAQGTMDRNIRPGDHETVRDLIKLVDPPGNLSRDGKHRYDIAFARLAADGSIDRALAIRADLGADELPDDGIGEYEICELMVSPAFGVVAVTVVEQGHDHRGEASTRALALLS